jgi:hypothetical protein
MAYIIMCWVQILVVAVVFGTEERANQSSLSCMPVMLTKPATGAVMRLCAYSVLHLHRNRHIWFTPPSPHTPTVLKNVWWNTAILPEITSVFFRYIDTPLLSIPAAGQKRTRVFSRYSQLTFILYCAALLSGYRLPSSNSSRHVHCRINSRYCSLLIGGF